MMVGVTDKEIILEKFGKRASARLDDEKGMWKILTNDMELNEETAMRILESVASKAAVAGGEVF